MSTQKIIYWNKSRDEADQKCPRLTYWNEFCCGTGVESDGGAFDLAFGQWWHEAAAKIMNGEGVEAAAAEAVENISKLHTLMAPPVLTPEWDVRCAEHRRLMWMLVMLFPESPLVRDVMANHTIVGVEHEIAYTEDRGDYRMVFSAKPDLLTREKKSGKLVYIEFKTTGFFTANYWKPYKRSPQLMGASLAVEQNYGEPLGWVVVQPILKGSEYKDVWDSPTTYLWRNVVGPSVRWSLKRPQSWSGWERVSTEEVGLANAANTLRFLGAVPMLFPEAPPIYVNTDTVNDWWEQRCRRRIQLEEANQRGIDADILASVFPQNFSQCEPMIGRSCDMLNCCWIQHVGADPLNHGFVQKVPHSMFDPRRVNEENE